MSEPSEAEQKDALEVARRLTEQFRVRFVNVYRSLTLGSIITTGGVTYVVTELCNDGTCEAEEFLGVEEFVGEKNGPF